MGLVKRRWLWNLALLAVVAALVFAFVRRHERPVPPAPELTALTEAGIVRVRLERASTPPIMLRKTGGRWRLTAPIAARANRFTVARLLALARVRAGATLATGAQSLAQYGLDRPVARLWLNGREIDFGAHHPFKDRIYVRYQGQVHLISARHLSAVEIPYTDLIDGRLFESRRHLMALTFPDFRLTKAHGVWRLTPANDKLSTDRINDFVSAWANAFALNVNRYSGAPVRSRIEITSRIHGRTDTLTLGVLARRPEFVLYRPDEGLEYHFPRDVGRHLLHLSAP